jgi:hypothetical protein
MAVADPRWLEILKASGGQSLAFAGAAGGVLLAIYLKLVPPLDPPWIHVTIAVFLLGTLLWLASVASALNSFFSPRTWLVHWRRVHHQKRAAEQYIPHMTDREKRIIGHLIHHNQKTFTGAADGGYAVTLISRGIVIRQMIGGQQASALDVPFGIPDHVWDVLMEHKDKFPYRPEKNQGTVISPWREPMW